MPRLSFRKQHGLAIAFAIAASCLVAPYGTAAGSTFQTLHFFGNIGDITPSPLTLGSDGKLYGTYQTNAGGTAFSLTAPKSGQPPWTFKAIYNFPGPGGQFPGGGVIMGPGGNLYGTTTAGGTGGIGTIYALVQSPANSGIWHESTLYNFPGSGKNGNVPQFDLIQGKDGALYGVTFRGGSAGAGAVFKLSPPAAGQTAGIEQVLFSFGTTVTKAGYPSGTNPFGPLLMDSHGALYGTTYYGGVGTSGFDFGVVFKLTPPVSGSGSWTETVLHAFNGAPDGAVPVGRLVMDSSGAIYGATESGGLTYSDGGIKYGIGVLYKLTPPAAGHTAWTETIIHTFSGGADGGGPGAGLVMDKSGALYGTTYSGGIKNESTYSNCTGGCGVVFKLTPPGVQTRWTISVLHYFTDGLDGRDPGSDLAMDASGALYGTTIVGGDGTRGFGDDGSGVVFKVTP
jgi:uncharacterized repeat protein (TIGR03803 family)